MKESQILPFGGTFKANRATCGSFAFLLMLTALVAIGIHAHAQNILNPYFGANTVSTDGGTNASVSSWVLTGTSEAAVTKNPSVLNYVLAAGISGSAPGMTGSQELDFTTSVNGSTASASQTTGLDLSANTNYTLSVEVGDPLTVNFQGYDLSLLSGTTMLATTGAQYNVLIGTFALESVSYNAGSNLGSLLNSPLTVELTAPPASGLLLGSTASVDFNNVELVGVASVPEPCDGGMVLISGVGVIAWRWRSRMRRRIHS